MKLKKKDENNPEQSWSKNASLPDSSVDVAGLLDGYKSLHGAVHEQGHSPWAISFLIERRAKAESNPRPSAYQRNALPQGQSVSPHEYLIHCGGTRSQTHSVHESQHSTRTGEPKRNRTFVPLLTSLAPFRMGQSGSLHKG